MLLLFATISLAACGGSGKGTSQTGVHVPKPNVKLQLKKLDLSKIHLKNIHVKVKPGDIHVKVSPDKLHTGLPKVEQPATGTGTPP